jgi:thiol-disulfide isomerase/thioredoxin
MLKFLITSFLFSLCIFANAQTIVKLDSSLIAYNTLPLLKVLQLDSTPILLKKLFIKNKPTVLIFFNPDCDHCQQELENIIAHNADVKNTQFICISNRPLFMVKPFAKQLKINKTPNIKMVSVPDNAMFRYYGIGGFPSMIIYNNAKIATKKYVSSIVTIADINRWTSAVVE